MSTFHILSGFDSGDYSSRKVAVAMSGGVDSSLSAVLLKEAGFDVIGLTMHLWDYDHYGGRRDDRGCCDLSTVEDARKVAADAGIPHYTVNLEREFESLVVEDFTTTYLSGRTPNPCVRCNTFIKWNVLRKKALALGCELIATGHYSRIACYDDGTFSLVKGVDNDKDQSYFLWGIDSRNLCTTLFPLGSMTKEQTRGKAKKMNLKTARRRESQEICFIPDNNYGRFLRCRFKDNPLLQLREGDILSTSGQVIGRHQGAAYYTIGQRKGIGVALGYPVYVTAIDTENNTITVGKKEELFSKTMSVTQPLWTRGNPPSEEFMCTTRIRYRHPGASSLVRITGEAAVVTFDTPQMSITPGQSAVFYDDDIVLGGGVIENANPREIR